MKLTIVTVCYNSEDTIASTIRSVLEQTYKDIEYIIVDGGSSDNTLSTIRKYEHKFNGNLYWVSESDNGLYDAMNKGMEMATGDLIGILNSDDTFYSNKTIEEIVTFHKQNDVEASVGNIIQHNENRKSIRFYSSKYWNPQMLKIGFMPPHPSIFIKRELFKKYGFYHLGFKIAADYELIVRYFLKNQVIWKYSGITTTSMLIGGLSSSGITSYSLITKEICKALTINNIIFSSFQVKMRFLFKIMEYFKVNKSLTIKDINT